MAPTKPTYRSPPVLWPRGTWPAKGQGIDVERYGTPMETEGWWGEERGGSGVGQKEGSFDRLDGFMGWLLDLLVRSCLDMHRDDVQICSSE